MRGAGIQRGIQTYKEGCRHAMMQRGMQKYKDGHRHIKRDAGIQRGKQIQTLLKIQNCTSETNSPEVQYNRTDGYREGQTQGRRVAMKQRNKKNDKEIVK